MMLNCSCKPNGTHSHMEFFLFISVLCRNRIALIQKEEERARKKIQETKERAAEIIALRYENERRVDAYTSAVSENKKFQQVLLAKNREQDTEGKKARQQRFEMLQNRRKEEVSEMVMEKKYLTQLMIQEQEREVQMKQKRRDEVRRMEEEMKAKKEQERREKERRMKEMYAKKLEAEALETKRAEKLVKALEKKEREWIERLKAAQTVQDTAYEQLERALTTHDGHHHGATTGPRSSISRSSAFPVQSSSSMMSAGSRSNTQSPANNRGYASDSAEPQPSVDVEDAQFASLHEGVSQLTLSTGKPSMFSSIGQQSNGSGVMPPIPGVTGSTSQKQPNSKAKGRSVSAGRSRSRGRK